MPLRNVFSNLFLNKMHARTHTHITSEHTHCNCGGVKIIDLHVKHQPKQKLFLHMCIPDVSNHRESCANKQIYPAYISKTST